MIISIFERIFTTMAVVVTAISVIIYLNTEDSVEKVEVAEVVKGKAIPDYSDNHIDTLPKITNSSHIQKLEEHKNTPYAENIVIKLEEQEQEQEQEQEHFQDKQESSKSKPDENDEFRKISKLFESSDSVNLQTVREMALTRDDPDFISEYVDLYVLKANDYSLSLSLVNEVLNRQDLEEPSLVIDFAQSLYNYTSYYEISGEEIRSAVTNSNYLYRLSNEDKLYISKTLDNMFSEKNDLRKAFFKHPGNESNKLEWISLNLPDQYQ